MECIMILISRINDENKYSPCCCIFMLELMPAPGQVDIL